MADANIPDAKPLNTLPNNNIGRLLAVAIKVHPMIPGMAANLTVFNLPIMSISTPPIGAPIGTVNTIILAENFRSFYFWNLQKSLL